jgi:hypothetical protein
MGKMNFTDIKLTILNSIVLFLSFSNIESTLKILLLIISILYTGVKTYDIYNNIKKNKQNANSDESK